MVQDIKDALRAGYIANTVMANYTAYMSYRNRKNYQERYVVETRPIIQHPIITVFDVCAAIEADNPNMFDPITDEAILTIYKVDYRSGRERLTEIFIKYINMTDKIIHAETTEGVFHIKLHDSCYNFTILSFDKAVNNTNTEK